MSSFKKSLLVSGLSLIVLGVGCAVVPYAREVKKNSTGGVVALRTTFSPEDRAKADSLMRTNCGGKGVKVTEEGEVTVGTRTNAQANTTVGREAHQGWFGWTSGPSVNNSSTSETQDIKEWQISYQCVANEEVRAEKKRKG
jgi:hypothetical protein